ncbi:hypothetical protein Q8F55_000970 [Vanrija albida]|uniref:Uncharacterized protein n=1 Tax=Vanrija albida TaxID=181172 RepID=A0ABR3QEY7_9TREE
MTITESHITPKPLANPTVKGTELPVAAISTWPVGAVVSVLAFPTALDSERLQNAVATAASYWPSVAGRYVKATTPGYDFAIAVTQSPIPYSTQTVDAEYPFADKRVVQPDLGSYLPPLAPDFFVAGADAPLLTVRLSTLSSGGSVLGINGAHILGDAKTFSRFIEDVSLFYNLPSVGLDGPDLPTFTPHVNIPHSTPGVREQFEFFGVNPVPLDAMMKGYAEAEAQSEAITVILTQDELKHITAVRLPGENVSDQDLLSGWWVSVLERAGQQFTDMVYTVNYRGMHKDHPAFPPNLGTLAANVAQMRKFALPAKAADASSTKRTAAIARVVRGALNELRNDADLTLKWLSNAADHLEEAAKTGQAQLLVPPPGVAMVNSNLRYDWAIKFGQPSANYHTSTSLPRFLRVFQANPREGADQPGERDVELVFRVEWGGAAEAVKQVIAEDRKRWATEPLPDAAGEDKAEEPKVTSYSFNNTVHQPAWGGYGN